MPTSHRGITIFSMLHRVVAGAWFQRLRGWQEGWLHEGIHGARSGHDALDIAWVVQAEMEKANLLLTPPRQIINSIASCIPQRYGTSMRQT